MFELDFLSRARPLFWCFSRLHCLIRKVHSSLRPLRRVEVYFTTLNSVCQEKLLDVSGFFVVLCAVLADSFDNIPSVNSNVNTFFRFFLIFSFFVILDTSDAYFTLFAEKMPFSAFTRKIADGRFCPPGYITLSSAEAVCPQAPRARLPRAYPNVQRGL